MIRRTHIPDLDAYEAQVAQLYDDKRDDINYLLAQETGLVHHHFGMGHPDDVDCSELSQTQLLALLHQLENTQVQYVIDALGAVQPTDRIFDGGSGRAGTALMLHDAFSCYYDGVTISNYQYKFSEQLVRERGIDDKVRFHLMNMRATSFPDDHFQYVVTNETTMYIPDLHELYAEFSRIIVPNGRYVLMTWSVDNAHPDHEPYIRPINAHYQCVMHTRSAYFTALISNNFIPYIVKELNVEALPYWEFRKESDHQTGVEQYFIDGYNHQAIKYLLIGTQYLPSLI